MKKQREIVKFHLVSAKAGPRQGDSKVRFLYFFSVPSGKCVSRWKRGERTHRSDKHGSIPWCGPVFLPKARA